MNELKICDLPVFNRLLQGVGQVLGGGRLVDRHGEHLHQLLHPRRHVPHHPEVVHVGVGEDVVGVLEEGIVGVLGVEGARLDAEGAGGDRLHAQLLAQVGQVD